MAGFTHWAVIKPEPCAFCSTATHATSVQGTLAQCTGTAPAAWRQHYFQLFPADWNLPAWFAGAGSDPRRRFVRTLAPDALMNYLKARNISVPKVQAAWKGMHKRWLPFWITDEKQFSTGGARPGTGSNPQDRAVCRGKEIARTPAEVPAQAHGTARGIRRTYSHADQYDAIPANGARGSGATARRTHTHPEYVK